MPRKHFGWTPSRAAGWILATLMGLSFCRPGFAQQNEPAGSGQKPIRPAPENLRVDHVDPDLFKILQDWERSSAKIKKLEGEHTRWEYDYVFQVVKRNVGKFYYESPDKGRIDLKPDAEATKPVNDQSPVDDRKHWENGKIVKFKVQAGISERWYCDGQIITQVNEASKEATQIVIPKQNQGERIIDGPLPFLFGMPAEKAVRRFDLKLLSRTKDRATIHVVPRFRQDAANYRLAQIILNTGSFLPEAVRLIDPAGTKETVFKFKEVATNPRNIASWFGADPFKPNLRSYKVVRQNLEDDRAEHDGSDLGVVPVSGVKTPNRSNSEGRAQTDERPEGRPKAPSSKSSVVVPSVVDLDWKEAQKALQELGFHVSFKQGPTASRADQVYRVESQEPDPKARLAPGDEVILWLYTKPGSKGTGSESKGR